MRSVLIWSYLFLAVLGAVLPWQANLEFMQTGTGTGFDLSGFIRDANLTAASRSLSRDLIIGATAFTIWIAIEGRRLQVKGWWVCLVLCVPCRLPAEDPSFCICVKVVFWSLKKRINRLIQRLNDQPNQIRLSFLHLQQSHQS